MILRRKRSTDVAENGDGTAPEQDGATPTPEEEPQGPWDASEREVDPEDGRYVDLGGLLVRGRSGLNLQIPMDDATRQPLAVVFAREDAAVEIRAFAAKRSGGVWDDIRSDITAEADRLKGRWEEVEGRHGTELRIQLPATTPEGEEAIQPSRIVGVEGPRWFLRATFLGRAAMEPDDDGALEQAFRDVVVKRGSEPMAPREPLPLVLPPEAVAVPDAVTATGPAETDSTDASDASATDATAPTDVDEEVVPDDDDARA